MEEKKTTPLRQRMIEDMNIRGLCEKTQKAHIRNVKHFASFLGRSPDTATPEDLRSYQLKMTEEGVTASTFNVCTISLWFFFGVTCDYRIKSGDRQKVMRLATPEFIRRFLIHVLPDGFHRIRHYGLLASSARKANITKIRALLCVQQPDRVATPEPKTEIAPLTLREPCPSCGRPMRIVEIFRRGQIPMSRAPPRELAA
ncbi:phage integrase N-terminal SAM-like domain-containing protein [Pseudooceanicola sp.]|uniref:phage integrase N-terminal SAM-like domain-containing protein n=1 Tax=Pseudooceanicola sp. TaxID=1914328 RepID=UPI003512380F